ncbi:MAG TPA: 5-methyltetrahydropteroyltriglutamate--homocysteine methyltransferase [Methanotrichaceae archaeon]|nr:5-methyltetrahydropteroyltriglutamate--homocysteine methyltransferase [Methanotrichaceae archaeon]
MSQSKEESALLFDDIGSFPLPKGVKGGKFALDQGYADLVRDAMAQKVAAGVEIPTYPQFRDMIRMFMDKIEDPEISESPYLIKPEYADIFELGALEKVCSGRPIRVCVTGPIELYLSAFGSTQYTDILYDMARSVSRFLGRALDAGNVAITSLDEPSLGMNSGIIFSEDEMIQALEIASEPCRSMDCEVHLHSPLFVELCSRVTGIKIIGIESASHPDYLQLIDRKDLEDSDKYIRAGIARTDILSMAARLNDLQGRNLWDEPAALEREIFSMESPETMRKRLDSVHALLGDRLRCAGPDCGLGSWPSQSMAGRLLSNCSLAIRSFRKDLMH